MRQVGLTALRTFLAVCEEGSIAKAAEREFIVASAVSKRMAEMEEMLGVTLLYRTQRGVTPTAAGEVLMFHARQMLQGLERMRGELSEYAQGARGHVRMHANISAIVEFLPEDLREFLRHNEHIKVDLTEHLSSDIIRAVREGQTDIGIVSERSQIDDLQFLPYKEDELVLITRPDHALAQETTVTYADTLACEHVGLATSSALYRLLEDEAARLGHVRKLRITVSGFDALCRMVGVGMGVGIVPVKVAQLYAQALGLKAVALQDVWARRQLFVVVRDVTALPVAARHLVAHLTEAVSHSRRSKEAANHARPLLAVA